VWDRAAGALIAAEAGARVLLPPPGDAGLVVAAAPGIAYELLEALKRFNGLDPIPD
jgi:myo-inositol-1(or 4)-monophosphatase